MTLSTEQHAATKVLTMADKLVDRRHAVRRAEPGETKRREVGRYEKSIDSLEEAVLEYRKAGAQPKER